jgi:hypothetical protein
MLTKEWFFSAKVLATLILIIFPLSYFILSYSVDVELAFPENLLLPYSPILLLSALQLPIQLLSAVIIPPVPLLVVLLIYAVYPTLYPVSKFFEKRGSENVLLEYYYIRKILFSAIIIMIIFIPLSIVYTNTVNGVLKTDPVMKNLQQQLTTRAVTLRIMGNLSEDVLQRDIEVKMIEKKIDARVAQTIPFSKIFALVYGSLYFVVPVSISIIVKLLIEHSRKLFKFYLAKACFEVVLKKSTNEVRKATYFKYGLIWYNRFLKKIISLEINNIDAFYESVLVNCSLDNNKTLFSLANTFEDKNEFTALRYLRTVLPLGEGEKMLTREAFATKVKESSELIIPIVTTLITLITTFFIKPL